MEIIFNVLVNISPFVMLTDMYIACCYVNRKNVFLCILYWIFYIIFVVSAGLYGMQFGNSFIPILLLGVGIFVCLIFLKSGNLELKVLLVLFFGWFAIVYLYFIYVRFLYDKEIIADFIKKLKNMDFHEILLRMFRNEWFKGIVIAVSGTVFGGLILKKLNKD